MARLVLFACLLTVSLRGQHNQLTGQEKAQGWTLLFDGKDTSAWRGTVSPEFPADSWAVEDGCLRTLDPRKFSRKEWQDLVTKRSFRNFELTFECRLTRGANSGVKYLVQRSMQFAGHHAAIGFEFQLIDDDVHPDAIGNPKRRTGAMYAHIAPSEPAALPIGEFNRGRIVWKNNLAEHWLNGVKVVSYRPDDEALRREMKTRTRGTTQFLADWSNWDCPISLQHHDAEVWFRNLKIRSLD